MRHKRITLAVVAVLFLVSGSVAIAASRDVTSRLGGKAGDVFKFVGGLVARTLQLSGNLRIDGSIYRGKSGIADGKAVVINDNAQIKGSLTVADFPVAGLKRYAGTFDTAAAGDYVAISPSTTDCALFPAGWKSVQNHWKAIVVPEASLTTLVDIRVYWKPVALSTYTNNQFPNSANVWSSAGFTLSDGYVWVLYKYETIKCDDTSTFMQQTTGDYVVIVN